MRVRPEHFGTKHDEMDLIRNRQKFSLEKTTMWKSENKSGDILMQGGYFTVILASFFGIVMAIMYYGRKIRNRFITFDKIGPAIPVITALSRDHTLPKFCSQLVYTTHADNKTDIEAKTIYSIITRQPKRADVYWFLHVQIS